MIKFVAASLLSLAIFNTAAVSQDAKKYSINLSRDYKVGDKHEIVINNVESSQMQLIEDGAIQDPRVQKIETIISGTQEVLAVTDGKLSKTKITVSKLVSSMGAKEETLLEPGSVIEATYEPERVTFKVDGNNPVAKAQAVLVRLFQPNKEGTDDDELFGSKEKHGVGDKWEVNSAATAEGFSKNGMSLTKEQIKGWMKIIGVVEKSGVECLEIHGEIEMAKFAPPLPPGMTLAESGGKITMKGFFPVDGATQPIDKSMRMEFKVGSQGDQNGKAVEVLMKGDMQRATGMKAAK